MTQDGESLTILYLHQYFKTPREKGGTRSYEMARRLVSLGHEVEMIAAESSGVAFSGWRVSAEAGIRIHRLFVPYRNSMAAVRRIRAFFRFAYGAARRAAAIKADVIFASSTPLTIALPAGFAALRQKVPMVFEVRDLWPELPIAMGVLQGRLAIAAARRLERWAYRRSSRVVALSPGMKEGIVRTGYPADRVHVIPNCCDLDLFRVPHARGEAFRSSRPWLGDRPLVVYTGVLGRANGVDYLARLASYMAEIDGDVRFLVVGDGARFDAVKKVAAGLGVLERNFFMMPAVPKNEIPDILSAADVATSLVIDIPELRNNSSNKFFDALASRTPVAINFQGWLAELLTTSHAGLVLDGKDPRSGAQDLSRVLRDPEWLREAGAAASRLAEERFDRDRLAKDLESVLLRAVGNGSRPQ